MSVEKHVISLNNNNKTNTDVSTTQIKKQKLTSNLEASRPHSLSLH